jgi:ATP adenylyltransferase
MSLIFSICTNQKSMPFMLCCSKLRMKYLGSDTMVTGFNFGVNVGQAAGQSIFHVHVHLIPHRDGDVERPRGGVRGIIPSKQDY